MVYEIILIVSTALQIIMIKSTEFDVCIAFCDNLTTNQSIRIRTILFFMYNITIINLIIRMHVLTVTLSVTLLMYARYLILIL